MGAFPTSSPLPHNTLLNNPIGTSVASKFARLKDPPDAARLGVLAPSLPPEILAKLGYTENTSLRHNLALPSEAEPTLFRPSTAMESFDRGPPSTGSAPCEAATAESMARRRLEAEPRESRIPSSLRVANQQPSTLRANF